MRILKISIVFFSFALISSGIFVVAIQAQDDNLDRLDKHLEYLFRKAEESGGCYFPEDGMVPNGETASKIAEAILLPIYGDEIYDQKPFGATLIDDSTWIVYGYSGEEYNTVYHGEALVKIRKSDGKIQCVLHTK